MTVVHCRIKDCGYRHPSNGVCLKPHIVLQPNDIDVNELFCLMWVKPEQWLFNEIMINSLSSPSQQGVKG